MSTLTHPSGPFPAPPAVAVVVPQGWEQLATPGTALSAIQRVPAEQEFSSNVVVRTGTRRSEDQVMDFVMELRRTLEGLDGLTVSEPMTTELDGVPFTLLEARFVDGRRVPVRQLHAVALLARGEVADFVQVTASCGGAAVESGFGRVDEVVRSVRVGASAEGLEPGPGVLVQPSASHPGPPAFTVEVPDTWQTTTVPTVALAAVDPAPQGQVACNVVVRTLTLPGGTTTETQVAELRATVEPRLDGRVDELGPVPVGDDTATVVALSWTDPSGVGIAQLHGLLLLPRPDGLVDHVDVTGTVGRDDTEAYAEVERVVRSIRIVR